MSGHAAFRRQPVPGEMALRHATVTLPAPIKGIVENENWAYVKPGAANILDNWFPTQKGLRLRGGTERWAVLPAPVEIIRTGFNYDSGAVHRMFAATATRIFDVSFADNPVLQTGVGTISNGNFSTVQFATMGGDWLLAVNDLGDYPRRFNGTIWEYLNPTGATTWVVSTAYAVNAVAKDTVTNTYWKCLVAHTSAASGTFSDDRTAHPTYWQTAAYIVGPATAPAPVFSGGGLTYVWKYRNRLFFIEGGTMNAWCLPVNAIGGELIQIPLSGAAKRGGSLLFGARWSTGDSGDSGDDKCCFFTDQGEVLVFLGTDPTQVANWRQEGRYDISKPLGKNGHTTLGADVLVITVDGIVPLSAAIQKDLTALSLAAITYNIEPMWMREFRTKNAHPWTLAKWDEGDALFVTFPGGELPGTKTVGVSNLHTGAWCRYTNWDAMCFMRLSGSLFFGTQDGKIMQIESTGFDDTHWDDVNDIYVGNNYVCTMVGGWEMFQAPPNQVTWYQARAAFFSSAREQFEPQLSATTDYEFRIPPPPNPGPDPGLLDVWDQGLWGLGQPYPLPWGNLTAYVIGDIARDTADSSIWTAQFDHITGAAPLTFAEARAAMPTLWILTPLPLPPPPLSPPTPAEWQAYAQWDQPAAGPPPVKNTMWVSIGETGFSHAPIVQVNVAQQARPDVELISVSATFLRMAANV